MPRLSKHQRKILELLTIKPEMTTKDIAETIYGKLINYKTKEYTSIHRSILKLEKQGLIQRVQIQLRWKIKNPPQNKPQ